MVLGETFTPPPDFSGSGYYLLESGDVEIEPVSAEVWARRGQVREEFIEAWGNPSPYLGGLSELTADTPCMISDRDETFGQFLLRYSQETS